MLPPVKSIPRELLNQLTLREYITMRRYYLMANIDPDLARRSGTAARQMLSRLSLAETYSIEEEYTRLRTPKTS